MSASAFALLSITFVLVLLVWKGVHIVPQQQIWIVEKLGKFDRALQAGLNFILPYIERVAYKQSLKEEAIDILEQTAITNDNVTLRIDGVLYVRITDPVAASYGIQNLIYAISQLAQTTMRSEIGKMALDKTFEERDNMNANIVRSINEASNAWGIQCMRYEIKDITPPESVLKAMELQVAAERQKRAAILESEGRRQAQINDSEGKRQSQINLAESDKQEIVLRSEAALTDQVNRAKGEAEALLMVAEATAKGIEVITQALQKQGSQEAVSLRLAEQYIEAFKQLAKENNTLIIPANAADVSSLVAQAMSTLSAISQAKPR